MADIIDVHYQPLSSYPTASKIRVESPGNVEMGGKIDSIRLCVAPQWKTTLRYLSYVFTGFIMYLFNLWIPKLSIAMTLSDSNLRKAKKVVVYGADKNIEVVNLFTETTSTQTLKVFTYRLFKYYYDEKDQAFKACQFKIDHLTFTQIHETYGQGLEEENYQDNAIFFGKNLTDIPKKPWTTLLFQEVLSPFYIFQVYSVMVWAFDNYWVYGIMIIFFSVSSVTVTLYQTIKTTNKLRQMSYYEIQVYVHRRVNGTPKRIQVNSSELVPGDLMEIPEGVMMPCDAVILNGTCIMNEAMLTGESIPVIKNPFPMSDVHYNVKEDKQYTLFAGTKCIQARYYQGSAVFGLVTLTGFATVKGELIRTMLFPKPTDFKFYSDSFKFVGILAAVAIAGFLIDLPSWINSDEPGMAERIIIKASEIITITVPPALPTCMQIGISVALARLKKKQIFCISPGKINEAGRVNVMCFDKTGTLTEDGLDLLGVRPVIYDKNSKKLGFSKLVKKITTLSTAHNSGRDLELHNISSKSPSGAVNLYERTKMLPPDHMQEILATCHSLTMVNGKMIGDPLDLKMFECTKWNLDEELNQFDNGERILARAIPLLQRETNSLDQTQNGTAILRRFEFSSKLQRMSVIVKNFADGNYKVHVKGSPEKIRELCRAESVPINFHSILEKYTRDGYRVLACATKLLEPHHKVGAVQRDDIEKDFTFIGLLIMENKLKNITTQIIHQLHEAQIRTIMVTGDNALTAISVARQCNIISPAQRVFLGDLSEKKVDGKEVIQWKDFEFSDRVLNNNLDYDMEADSKLSGSFDFMNTSHKTIRVSEGGITLNGDENDPSTLPPKRQSTAKDLATSMRSNSMMRSHSMMKSNRLRNSSGTSGARISKVSAARLSQSGMKDQSPTEIKNINKKLLTSSANVVEVDAPFFAMEEDENYCIAVTGKAFSLILHEAEVKKNPQYQFILQQMLRKCLVFARMHPDEKALMIKHMMVISNNIVGMCGDGANDVGALKTANVGVSLSEAEASIAAPFTSNIQDISCIPTLLMEGRAALSTSYQAFKFMALYSIIQFSSVTLLFHELIDLTNWHYYHIDMLIILPLSGTMALTQTHDELTIFKPTGRLVSVQILSSVLGQGLIQILFQLGTLLILMNKSWYSDYSCINDFETYNPCVENTSLYLVSIYQYCTVAIVFMVGRPFRKPFYTNLWFTCIWCVLILINLIMTYNPFHWGFITEQSLEAEVELYSSWKNEILTIVAINSTLTIIWERLVVRHVSIWWKNYRDEKQREKEERELQLQGNKMTTSNLLAY